MNGNNQINCQICKQLTDGEVCSKIYLTPPYLIINFDYGKKIDKPIDFQFGELIDLTNFTEEVCKDRFYELVSICAHIGPLGSKGHYIAYCKNQIQNENAPIWYKFNESFVSKVDFDEVRKQSPLFLIYRKKKII